MTTEPVKPLFEDASAPAELREFVTLARADGPSQAELDRLANRVAPALGVPRIVAPSVTALGSPPAGLASDVLIASKSVLFGKLLSSTSAKILAAIGLSASVGVGLWSYRSTPSRRPANLPVASGDHELAVSPEPVAEHAPGQRTPAADDRLSSSLARGPARFEPAEPAPIAAAPDALTRAPGASTRAMRTSARPSRASVATTAAAADPSPGTRPTAGAAAPASELELIERAEALRARTTEALSLLSLHEQLYPSGALAQEREALAIEVLLRAGQIERAKARARRFERAYPGSAHAPHVRALMARRRGE